MRQIAINNNNNNNRPPPKGDCLDIIIVKPAQKPGFFNDT